MEFDWLNGLGGLAYPPVVAPPGLFTKYSSEVMDYLIYWSNELPTGDVIIESTWTADAGITIERTSFTDLTATVWLSGGTAGWLYHVTNHITTLGGRQTLRCLRFKVKSALLC